MRAIIILGHGSRNPNAGRDMETAAELLKTKYQYPIVTTAFLTFSQPKLPDALLHCTEQGADEIMVIPYFLNEGIHIRRDIPDLLKTEAAKYPDVKIILARRLGFDPVFVDVLQTRIFESLNFPHIADVKIDNVSDASMSQ